MADVPVTPVVLLTSPKKAPKAEKEKKSAEPSKPKSKATHPPTSIMVNNAIEHLKERGGSSLQAIKKYISATYEVDAEKISPFIKKYLKSSVTSGAFVLIEKPKDEKPVVVKKTPVKKITKPKKSPAKKAVKPKSPSKAKNVAKIPAQKPKSPKPKSVKPKTVAKSPKRVAPKRK